MGAMENDSRAAVYVGWEDAVVSSEKGQREIHYYLKRRGGGRDLVVVGKDKSSRHTSYRYTAEGKKLLLSFCNRPSWLKLRSRREVIDWLNSFISDEPSCMGFTGTKLDGDVAKNLDSQIGVRKNDFTWLGSPWTCRKRRNHYQSFCRNGAVISANDFVYVLAEEGKRLVAYLDDMYEDSRGSKMVVVRWFHKLDEVGFILPHNYNDREIFFSLCLQDLSIECIDGLATVLSPDHYEKFFDQATSIGLMPFVCCRLFENDDVRPYDITRVKGYWNQGILKKKFPPVEHTDRVRPSKRIRWSIDCDLNLKSPNQKENLETAILKEGSPHESFPKNDEPTILKCREFLTIGSDIEILSQDSGIRGCWFRASVIKKHKDKVKVQYRDLKDALDDMKPLKEWILATRIASLDALGIRLSGRMVARPIPGNDLNQVAAALNVGCVVDAWWNDGWWEGIVASAEPKEKIKVYFPGEKQELIFSPSDLRHSKEWLDNRWHSFDERPDIVSSIYATTNTADPIKDGSGIISKTHHAPVGNNKTPRKVIKIVHKKHQTSTAAIRDLLKDSLLSHLRWRSSGKRRRRSSRSPIHKIQFGNSETGIQSLGKYLINSFDSDNCKYASDTHYSLSVVPPLTNLVMSR